MGDVGKDVTGNRNRVKPEGEATPEAQFMRFVETAQALGRTDVDDQFGAILARLATPKPKRAAPRRSGGAGQDRQDA